MSCIFQNVSQGRTFAEVLNGKQKLDTETYKSKHTGLADEFFAVGTFQSGVFQGSVKDGGVRSILMLFVFKT